MFIKLLAIILVLVGIQCKPIYADEGRVILLRDPNENYLDLRGQDRHFFYEESGRRIKLGLCGGRNDDILKGVKIYKDSGFIQITIPWSYPGAYENYVYIIKDDKIVFDIEKEKNNFLNAKPRYFQPLAKKYKVNFDKHNSYTGTTVIRNGNLSLYSADFFGIGNGKKRFFLFYQEYDFYNHVKGEIQVIEGTSVDTPEQIIHNAFKDKNANQALETLYKVSELLKKKEFLAADKYIALIIGDYQKEETKKIFYEMLIDDLSREFKIAEKIYNDDNQKIIEKIKILNYQNVIRYITFSQDQKKIIFYENDR